MFTTATVAPILALLCHALVWGVSWWPLKKLQAMGLHPLWATAFIYLLAAIVIWLWRPKALRLVISTPSLWWILIAAGITNAAFNWAVGIGDVVRVVLLFYLMPLWSLLLARLLLKERVTLGATLRALLAVAGAACLLAEPSSSAVQDIEPYIALADVLAVISGFSFALNTVMLRRGAALPNEGRAIAMFIGGALVAGVAAGLLSSGMSTAIDGVGWPVVSTGWLLPIGGLATAFLASNLFLQYGAARVPARVTAVVMPCEVFFASVTAVWWGGTALHGRMILGGGLILSAAVLSVWSTRRTSQVTPMENRPI